MKILYIDCGMGAAGDMLTAALYELLDDEMKKEFLHFINSIGLEGVELKADEIVKCGIQGTGIRVSVFGQEEESCDEHSHNHEHEHTHEHPHNHEHEHTHVHDHKHPNEHAHDHEHTHHHTSMLDIYNIINKFPVSQTVRDNALKTYGLIAEAESHVHGVAVNDIHFHEVGSLDAIVDVMSVSYLLDKINPDKIIASPVHVGAGHVHCAHGILPVPAPATSYILKDIPIYGGSIQGELCTPTGAALLKCFVDEFSDMPVMKLKKTGYGMGKKDFERLNCIRVMLGEKEEEKNDVIELNCNIDDMTAEELSFACELLYDEGALEVFSVAAGMKKSRMGVLLTVLCREDKKEDIVRTIFKHTSTIGVREKELKRYTLSRSQEKVFTEYGDVRIKKSSGYGVERVKYEYEDLALIAKREKLSIREVLEKIQK